MDYTKNNKLITAIKNQNVESLITKDGASIIINDKAYQITSDDCETVEDYELKIVLIKQSRFRVGQWININYTNDDENINKNVIIYSIKYDKRNSKLIRNILYRDGEDIIFCTRGFLLSSCEPWIPKYGDLCFFSNDGDFQRRAILSRYEKSIKESDIDFHMCTDENLYTNIEPFTGHKPSNFR